MKNNLLSIIYALLAWVIGVSFYLVSFYLPVLKNAEMQANITLAFSIFPAAYLSTTLFYRNGSIKPISLAIRFVLTATLLDTLFTVPIFVIPAGGSYQSFFSNPSFYLIAAEYFLITILFSKKFINKHVS